MNESPLLLAAFYKFFDFPDYEEHRAALRQRMVDGGIKGTLLLSPEGVNSTISGPPEAVRAFINHLRSDPRMADLEHKESFFGRHPFNRTLVRLKKEIMGLGAPVNVHEKVGTYVQPEEWNDLIGQEDVFVLDTRNTYETHLGTFKGAVDPRIHHFKELPEYVSKEMNPAKHKRVATFCTGGIRCEKFTAYLLDQGFEEVYHLKGGILKYLEEVPQEQSTWEGECFVFDHRVGVGHGLEPTKAASACYACGHSLLPQDREHPDFVANVRCPYCEETKKARAEAAKTAG